MNRGSSCWLICKRETMDIHNSVFRLVPSIDNHQSTMCITNPQNPQGHLFGWSSASAMSPSSFFVFFKQTSAVLYTFSSYVVLVMMIMTKLARWAWLENHRRRHSNRYTREMESLASVGNPDERKTFAGYSKYYWTATIPRDRWNELAWVNR